MAGQGATTQLATPAATTPKVEARPATNGSTNGHTNGAAKKPEFEPTLRIDGNGGPAATAAAAATQRDQFARFQLDAPSCDNCGAITVRNGNCYLCHNCGNSMGCS